MNPAKRGERKPTTDIPIKFNAVPLPSDPSGTLSIVAAVIIGITEKKNIPKREIKTINPIPVLKIKNRNRKIDINIIAIIIISFLPYLSDSIPMIGVEIIPAAVIRAM